ncbi:hypothetical protein Q4519_20640 [Motilimonas sp. 1_MG-2023]|uniref:hypothetical protein n=1 Tax=Motilimonas sp. 1_MG-2023 TaxID=3062672 RepID=UPI0026E22CA7|nr:hypothetical protein [Motilimonas sp. 1_MG-2023]MDO6528086.1 hypothetical protein [Motilimonas sp. 1_MG-2023]
MSISKEQWADIESKLSGLYGTVKLMLEGRTLTLEKRLITENQLAIVVFIDGSIKPTSGWIDSKHYDPFVALVWRKRSKALYSAARVKKAEKELGKRAAKRWMPDLHKKLEYYEAFFPTFASLKRVLAKQKDLQMFVEPTDAEAEPCQPAKD